MTGAPSTLATGKSVAGLIARIALPLYAACLAGRAILLAWQWDRLADLDAQDRLMAFVHGLRMDTIAVGWLLSVPVLVAALSPARFAASGAKILRWWSLASLALVVFVEVATFPFFAEYDARPNFLFSAYVEYPLEVASMLWADQKAGLAAAAALVATTAWWQAKRLDVASATECLSRPWLRRAAWFPPMAACLFLGIRSSLGHRPANTADALYCANRVAGEIAKNSLHSAAYEAYRGRKDGKRLAKQYGEIPRDEAYARVDRLLGTPRRDDLPFHRVEPTVRPSAKPRNLVVIIEESMGARFVGHLGDDRGLTPRLDELAEGSLVFTNLHSNGTRSIRGLSALSAGFQAIPGDGVLKRPKSQSGFFTLSSLLEPHGYHTSFIYGGEARFDNMRGWYAGNGFDLILEEKDFDNVTFRGSWGACDEDAMVEAVELYSKLHAEGRPFASVVFSQSNHSPFDLPPGKVPLVEGVPERSVENAIRYADYAIGRFFELARQQPWHADTVYLVAADHDVRAYGDAAVPVDAFHIPGLVHGQCVEPGRHDAVASQPDLLATALGHLGMDLEHPILGTPVSRPGRQAFALMQYNDAYGFRRGDKVAVLRPSLEPETFVWSGGRLLPTDEDVELERDGLALVHVAEDLYERRLYR
ncbi:MAG: hypothetical protein RL112_2654 [Planctomycetota bacterium]|jgi:phosphoglycerol transferase MdoB-like AlkP superfamily enzyme